MTRSARLVDLSPRFAAVGLLALSAGACGGKGTTPALGSRGGGGLPARGPAMLFVAVDEGRMFEAACHQCDALREHMIGQTVSSGASTFRITGPVSDECDASGPTDVTGVTRLSGDPDSDPLELAVLPAGADIGLVTYPTDRVPASAATLLPALVRRAQADVQDGGAPITADQLTIDQVIEVNVAGDARPETLVTASVPLPDDDGPGYRWSALVMLPAGHAGGAVTLWQSTLETMTIDASYDLEGDGVRDLVYSARYYEGYGRGAATINGSTLALLGTWGCGA